MEWGPCLRAGLTERPFDFPKTRRLTGTPLGYARILGRDGCQGGRSLGLAQALGYQPWDSYPGQGALPLAFPWVFLGLPLGFPLGFPKVAPGFASAGPIGAPVPLPMGSVCFSAKMEAHGHFPLTWGPKRLKIYPGPPAPLDGAPSKLWP